MSTPPATSPDRLLSVATVPPAQLAELRAAACDYVLRATDCLLDGSEESLAFADHYLDRLKQDPPKRPEVLRLVAFALGAYLGELAIARFGGRWVALKPTSATSDEAAVADPALAPLRWRVDLDAAPLRFDPIGMVAAAVARMATPLETAAAEDSAPEDAAPEDAALDPDSEEDGIALRPGARHLQGTLHATLSQLAPVSPEYYYSLTGRFETLSHIVDLVLEIQQQRANASQSPDGSDEAEPVLH